MFKKLKFSFFQRKKTEDSKLSLGEIVWFGFNYSVGIAFTASFAGLIYGTSKSSLNLGTHLIWIFIVEGAIAATCAWVFARLSRIHPGNNGAAYIYTRSTYGRFWAWIIAFVQYASLPMVVTSQIISMIRINFTDPASFIYINLGHWTNFGLDIMGITIYGLVSCVLFLGIKTFKKFVNASAYIKWGTTFLLMIAAIVIFAKAGTSNYQTVISHQKLTMDSFSQAFTSCFFFFLGFETYATIGKNIQNPQKNIGRSVIIVMLLSTIFYVAVIVLMIGAISGAFSDNPNLQVFNILGTNFNIAWIGKAGIIIMLISTISLKANAGMQNALYSGAILEPLANEGYISEKFKELNKDKIPFRASRLNLVVTFSIAAIFLLVPDLIQAISDTINNSASASKIIDYNTITGETSLIMILIYICVITVALRLVWKRKMTANLFEISIWTIALVFLSWQAVMWFYNLGFGFSDSIQKISATSFTPDDVITTLDQYHAQGVTSLISNTIQVLYLLVVIIFAIIWYLVYYQPKLKQRLANNTQKEFDDQFNAIDHTLDADYQEPKKSKWKQLIPVFGQKKQVNKIETS